MSRYKGWTCKREYLRSTCTVITYRHPDYPAPIHKIHRSYVYYYDSPGGQRSRRSFDTLRDAIADMEASHE